MGLGGRAQGRQTWDGTHGIHATLKKNIARLCLTGKSHSLGHCAGPGMVHWDFYNLKAGGHQGEEVTRGRREEAHSLQPSHLLSVADSGSELWQ